jgi:NADPH-dependent curcumin reductase CurA
MTTQGLRNREIHLASRPDGAVTLDNFSVEETGVRPPDDGEVVVRNTFISVYPYMRGRMNDVKSYVPPYQVGEVLDGGALGEVIESRSPDLDVGDVVAHNFGWREYATAARVHARFALCGMISQYDMDHPQAGPRNMTMCVGKRLTLRGFIIFDHAERMRDFVDEVGPAIADGRITTRETIVDGIENAPDAFLGLLRGDNTGKMLVRCGA